MYNKYIKILLIILFVLLGTLDIVYSETVGNMKLKNQDLFIHSTLIKISRQINSQLPVMIDNETRLDTTIVIGKNLFYKHTLINVKKEELDGNKLSDELRRNLKNSICSNENIMKMLSLGIIYNYLYFDKAGVLITSVNINKNIAIFT